MRPTNLFIAAGAVATLCLLTSPVAGQDTTVAPATEQVDTSRAEEVVTPLDGEWKFETPDGKTGAITIPCRWDKIKGLRNAHQVNFTRRFDLPNQFSHPGQKILVRFEAIGEFGELWINGKYAGEALAGPLPVEFDITGLVAAPSTDNVLSIRIKDDTHFSVPRPSKDWRDRRHWIPHGIGGNNRKGLFQDVTLRGRPGVHIRDIRIQTSVRKHQLSVVYELFNSSRENVSVKLGADVRPSEDGEVKLVIPARQVELLGLVTTTIRLTTPWQKPKLWQPNHPYLYKLRSLLTSANGKPIHQRDDRFGFREVWFEGIHFYLNGIRCNLRGESPSYAQHAGSFGRRDTTEAAVRKCLAANFNVLRFHAAPAPPYVYDVCDELGMMVIDESAIYASWGMVMPEHPRWLPECRRHLRRWVRRDRNHPSIILWSAENEGLNVHQLSPAQLADFRKTIDQNDGTRPVIFDGDGSGFGASPASCKHYVRKISDLEQRGGKSSGYGRDLRNDIYWAAEYKQDLPLGIGEFLYPANDAMRTRLREVYYMMGLQTRGYRYADWFDIRPYNPHATGFMDAGGLKDGYEELWDAIVKSFAPVAVFDKHYDELGPFPDAPVLKNGARQTRTLIVYNDTFEDEDVTLHWTARLDGRTIKEESKKLQIPLGTHIEFDISFTPEGTGQLALELVSLKQGEEQFKDVREFIVQ